MMASKSKSSGSPVRARRCRFCDAPIPAARLEAVPDATTCVACARKHPAKFDTIVEPLIGHPVEVPDALKAMLEREASAEPMAADTRVFAEWLRGWT